MKRTATKVILGTLLLSAASAPALAERGNRHWENPHQPYKSVEVYKEKKVTHYQKGHKHQNAKAHKKAKRKHDVVTKIVYHHGPNERVVYHYGQGKKVVHRIGSNPKIVHRYVEPVAKQKPARQEPYYRSHDRYGFGFTWWK